jgi:hypothetical protein
VFACLSDGNCEQLHACHYYLRLSSNGVNATKQLRTAERLPTYSMSCLIEYQAIIVFAIDYHDPGRMVRH